MTNGSALIGQYGGEGGIVRLVAGRALTLER
jgi:hypothetical protein